MCTVRLHRNCRGGKGHITVVDTDNMIKLVEHSVTADACVTGCIAQWHQYTWLTVSANTVRGRHTREYPHHEHD